MLFRSLADTALTFGIRNSGNTTVSKRTTDTRGDVGLYALFPSSVRVTGTPKECHTSGGGPEHVSAYPLTPRTTKTVIYECFRTVTLKPGDETRFTFHIVPLKAVPGQYAGMQAVGSEDPTADSENNVAHVTINATTSAAAPAATGTNAPSSDGDSNGSLAATGAGGGALWATAAGAALLLGAGAVTVTRRRGAGNRG